MPSVPKPNNNSGRDGGGFGKSRDAKPERNSIGFESCFGSLRLCGFLTIKGHEMKQVFKLETFEDIEKAFVGIREPDDPVPVVGEKDCLVIGGDWMRIESKSFVLSENMQASGRKFVEYCIYKVIGPHFDAEKALK
jgi:hypothetical protein